MSPLLHDQLKELLIDGAVDRNLRFPNAPHDLCLRAVLVQSYGLFYRILPEVAILVDQHLKPTRGLLGAGFQPSATDHIDLLAVRLRRSLEFQPNPAAAQILEV